MKKDKNIGGRTKEEILAQRWEMMKSKVKRKVSKSPQKQDPKQDMLDWLARGERAKVTFSPNPQIDKKDMLKLTQKNYDMLPEVQKKKEEEWKRKEFEDRMSNVWALEQKRIEMTKV